MGVPAFFRWLMDRYPKTLVTVKEQFPDTTPDGDEVPVDTSLPNPNGREFDNLYLDMNGIIHPASHPEDRPAPRTEDDMYLAIFAYLERVFAAVRPRKLLYMAIDGVAPRAKMNQQRSRRFRSAQEMREKQEEVERLRQEWEEEGRALPPIKDKPFDSNVITPGTPFMHRLAVFLRCFVQQKITSDPGWKNIKVVFSDAAVPGEGEHKIMEYIRIERSAPDYDPNTSHVIHGLDADLIMLALATHEPHFSILREQVFFEKVVAKCQICGQPGHDANECQGAEKNPEEGDRVTVDNKPFQFLHVAVLREYLVKEFQGGDYSCAGGFNLERVIDDFVFLCFFVGNDFLPHLPSLDIREGAIDTLMRLYRERFPEFGGYITENGEVKFTRARVLLNYLKQDEDAVLRNRRSKEHAFQQSQKRKMQDIQDLKNTQEHLRLIRQLTTDIRSTVVPVARDGPDFAQNKRLRYESDVSLATTADSATADDFRIKNKTAGGLRALPPGEKDEMQVRRLHLLDKIRSFHDDTSDQRPAKIELKDLDGRMRALAHGYCTELGLEHKSVGQEPNRRIVVSRPNEMSEGSAADVAASFDDAVSSNLRQKGDDAMATQVDEVDLGAEGWKQRYYTHKFGDSVDRLEVARSYLEGLCWVMKYYYQGCASWNWFFPYHYAAFPSDLVDFLDTIGPTYSPHFTLGKPFKPFEQLMGVFPIESNDALPVEYRKLMTTELKDFYPTEFELDLNGKRHQWQAVVLLPFIDEERLLTAIRKVEDSLDAAERERNSFGPAYLFFRSDAGASLMEGAGDKPDTSETEKLPPFVVSMAKLNELSAAQMRAEVSGGDDYQRITAELDEAKTTRNWRDEHCWRITASKHGLGGFLCKSRPQDSTPVGNLCTPPEFRGLEKDNRHMLTPMVNQSHCCCFYLPDHTPRGAKLHPRVTMPPPVLDHFDMPQLGRFASRRGGPPSRPLSDREPCRDFQRGHCPRGDSCRFPHVHSIVTPAAARMVHHHLPLIPGPPPGVGGPPPGFGGPRLSTAALLAQRPDRRLVAEPPPRPHSYHNGPPVYRGGAHHQRSAPYSHHPGQHGPQHYQSYRQEPRDPYNAPPTGGPYGRGGSGGTEGSYRYGGYPAAQPQQQQQQHASQMESHYAQFSRPPPAGHSYYDQGGAPQGGSHYNQPSQGPAPQHGPPGGGGYGRGGYGGGPSYGRGGSYRGGYGGYGHH